MNPQRKRRLLWVLLLVAASGLATALVAMALQ
ncbi:MAG: cytochrome c biogenesis protein CcmE, partial [Stenotrophomonas sp.]|nr:cytochrome c biogenesis protein CcmE [Stenotrophomonas sp.]